MHCRHCRGCLGSVFFSLFIVGWSCHPAAANLFLYVEGIPGNSTDPMHRDWIVAREYELEANRAVLDGGAPQNGAVQLSDLVVTAEASVASPGVFEALLLGRAIPTVRLDLMQAFGVDDPVQRPIAQWELDRVHVTDFRTAAMPGGEVVDRYQFYFEEITYRYLSYDAAGNLRGQSEFSFDRATGAEAVSTSGEGAAPAPDGTASCQSAADLAADFDGDGLVAGSDFLRWQRGLGSNFDATREEGDANGDGRVDREDLRAWQANYGTRAPLSGRIPEPTSCLLAIIACVALPARVR